MNRPSAIGQHPPVVTVTLTPAVDLTIPVEQLIPGKLHRVSSVRQDAGGKGINVAKALAAFGVPTFATGLIGGERGQFIQATLTGLGVMHRFVETIHETRMNVKVTDSEGQLTEFNSASPVAAREYWDGLEELIFAAPSPGQWLALCGRLPEDADPDWYARMTQRARKLGMRTVLDASGDGLREGIKAGPDLVKPNRAELSRLVGQQLTTEAEIVQAARSLVAGGVGCVVASLGPEGLIGVCRDQVCIVKVPVIRAISSVGAGDTLVAGLLYGSLHDFSFADMLGFAAAAGTAAVSTPGTTQPTLESVHATRTLVQSTISNQSI